MKSFSKWTIAEVEKEFNVVQQKPNALLESWLEGVDSPSEDVPERLMWLQARLIEHVYDWNEYELRLKFIGQLLDLVDFDQGEYQSFIERVISAPYKDGTLSGDVDYLVATGRRVPEAPYFFLHEHKKDADSSGDPLGQLLVSMIAAQILNNDNLPIYGTYVVGRLWVFVVLDGPIYAVSLAYDATRDDILSIYKILQKAKANIDERVQSG